MKKYQAFGPDAEVYGQAMLAFTQSIHYTSLQPILARHNVAKIDPQHWYPQQIWLDVFNDIQTSDHSTSSFVSIGMKIAETALPQLPPELPFTELMLRFGEISYRAHNRGADIGYIDARVQNDQHITMFDCTPYPDEFVYGAYFGMAKRFLPAVRRMSVYYDEELPRRETGGKSTIVHIEWERAS
jgi:hypothetical protein